MSRPIGSPSNEEKGQLTDENEQFTDLPLRNYGRPHSLAK